jgi:hypothetical protein
MRAQEKHKRWREEVVKMEADKKMGLLYSKSIVVEGGDETVQHPPKQKKKTPPTLPNKVPGICRCGSTTHKRVSHRDCRFNPNNKSFNVGADALAVQMVIGVPPIRDLSQNSVMEEVPTETERTLMWDVLDPAANSKKNESDDDDLGL